MQKEAQGVGYGYISYRSLARIARDLNVSWHESPFSPLVNLEYRLKWMYLNRQVCNASDKAGTKSFGLADNFHFLKTLQDFFP